MAQVGSPPVIEISAIDSPGASGFETYSFDVIPAQGTSITSVEGRFVADVAGAMRQVNPFGLTTVLNDNNGVIAAMGENPLADSQFEFNSDDVVFVLDPHESGVELKAALAGVGPFAARFTIAHVVLADGVTGTWAIGVVQQESQGVSKEYDQLGVFGPDSLGLAGDYNNNGTVDAADYVVWRNTMGQSGMGLAADGNGDQQIDAGDYAIWRANLGQTISSGAPARAPIPEPTTRMILLAAALFFSHRSAWNCSRGPFRAKRYCRSNP